jgi:catechol 2,3-dioxygenase-like lactoylglutathione lyase family enzyme
MKLVRTCLLVSDVRALRDFYRKVLKLTPEPDLPEYAEFDVGGGGLALYDVRYHNRLAPGSAKAGQNRSAMIEVEVEDVDAEYARLRRAVQQWVKPPTTQPWGSRSIYFRDPEGNLVNLYSRVPAAR